MQPELVELADKDGRYPWEAFEFVLEALPHTQRMFGKEAPPAGAEATLEHHVTGRELLEGICDLARREFGLLAPIVFRQWGARRTDDFGEIIFALIDAGVLYKTERDRREDFHEIFDLETVLTEGYDLLANTTEGGRNSR
jgi:uncharacterized repeat protein (TIGR04138 family)